MYNTSAFCQRNIAIIDGEHGQICKLSAARTGLLTLFSAQLRCREGKYRGRANWQKRGVFSISIAKVRHELRVLNFVATFVAWLRIMYLTFRFVRGPDFSTKIRDNVKFILFFGYIWIHLDKATEWLKYENILANTQWRNYGNYLSGWLCNESWMIRIRCPSSHVAAVWRDGKWTFSKWYVVDFNFIGLVIGI